MAAAAGVGDEAREGAVPAELNVSAAFGDGVDGAGGVSHVVCVKE